MMRAERIVRRLRLAGHQVTPSRRVVVEAAAAQTRPFTSRQLCAAVARRTGSVGRATVFRTLELLERAGAVDRIHSLGGCASYVLRSRRRQHHFLVCAACNGVTELGDTPLATLLRSVAEQHAFRVEGDLVEIFGRCQAC